ncbi:MAG: glycosyltransferase family 2 protein [Deltaproteobacteria bacterium]|nr:glycosyltransferase family 2 protein [Deltaproteobacteria bacterium]
MRLSVVMPVYNERATIRAIVERVLASPHVAQLVVVDDFSNDGTREIARGMARADGAVKVLLHDANRGKGAAIRTGLAHCTGDCVVIQDADLEYDPSDYGSLVAPLEEGRADAVFGSRFSGPATGSARLRAMRLVNRALTALSNAFTGLSLTDMETCYKCFTRDVARRLAITQDRFGVEPEITARLAAMGCRVVEVPVGYFPRGYAEGKKIGVKDALEAVLCIWRYRRGAL